MELISAASAELADLMGKLTLQPAEPVNDTETDEQLANALARQAACSARHGRGAAFAVNTGFSERR